MVTTAVSAAQRKNIRIAIYTIKDEENISVYSRIGESRPYTGRSGQRYSIARMATPRGDATVALFKGVSQGQREAQTLIGRAIVDLKPDWILIVGIAGGASHADLTIGDVVVANEVLDFSYEVKNEANTPTLHPRTIALHRKAHAFVSMLQIAVRQIPQWSSESATGQRPAPPKPEDIRNDVQPQYQPKIAQAIASHLANPRLKPIALPATIGSSDALMKNTAFLAHLTGMFRLLMCVEMEAAGGAAACETEASVPLVVIRGISDIVGVERQASWTQYACDTSASLATELIKAGHFHPDESLDLDELELAPVAALESAAGTTTPSLLALRNISRFGDTDIFPRPYELGVFRDLETESAELIDLVGREFATFFPRYPPSHLSTLSQLGYAGFRWASQLDPLYNALLLREVIALSHKIESVRVRIDKSCVFSYRLESDVESGRLFNDEASWDSFLGRTSGLAAESNWVIKTDIADFYAHVSHERLRRTLTAIEGGDTSTSKIVGLLASFSRNSGVGLPVGGPAARILAEAYLNASDHLLLAKGIQFCRFADDYIMFAATEHEATRILAELAMLLAEHEGLSLQKMKTRIMRKSEYLRAYTYETDADLDKESLSFLKLKLRYDPYSPTADADYEVLKEHLSDYNVLGMLAAEMRKSRIHQQLTKKLLFATRFVDPDDLDSAVITIAESLPSLLSVFPSVASVLFSLLPRAKDNTHELVRKRLELLLTAPNGPTLLDVHRMISVRLLAALDRVESSEITSRIWKEWEKEDSVLVRKEALWGLIRRKAAPLVAPLLSRFERSSPWERRALLVGSFLADNGAEFRQHVQATLSPYEQLVRKWAQERGGNIFDRDVDR